MDTIIKIAEEQGMKLLGGIIVIVVGIILVRWLLKLLGHSERFTKIEPTIRGFLHNLIKVVLYIMGAEQPGRRVDAVAAEAVRGRGLHQNR